ncbi:MAG: ATP-binding cassette domain-containing protein, partial [Bacteroidetes bacterium]
MVSIQHLSKQYGQQMAVDDLTFEVKEGEILGFLGPNGAGKSTTMKLITGFIRPTAGTVVVDGHDVRTHPLEVRRRVGYLPEHNPLYLDMYVHEFLAFAGRIHGLRGKRLRTRIAEVIDRTGLSIEQHKKIGMLSKGYR